MEPKCLCNQSSLKLKLITNKPKFPNICFRFEIIFKPRPIRTPALCVCVWWLAIPPWNYSLTLTKKIYLNDIHAIKFKCQKFVCRLAACSFPSSFHLPIIKRKNKNFEGHPSGSGTCNTAQFSVRRTFWMWYIQIQAIKARLGHSQGIPPVLLYGVHQLAWSQYTQVRIPWL